MKFQVGNNKARKLTGEEVLEIRQKWLTGLYTYGALCIEYNVSKNTISNIVLGHTWRGMAGAELIGLQRQPPDKQISTPEFDEQASLDKLAAKMAEPPAARADPLELLKAMGKKQDTMDAQPQINLDESAPNLRQQQVNDSLDELTKGD
jgi:hypothetical protein